MSRLVLVLALTTLGVPAFADAPGETPARPALAKKRLRKAAAISYAATVAPVMVSTLLMGDSDRGTLSTIGGVISSAALLLGPSAGHCYLDRCWTTGLELRLVGAGVVAAMVVRDHYAPLDLGTIIVGSLAAASLWMTGFVWDAVTLPRAVRRYHREHSLLVAPLHRDGATGIALTGTL